MVESIGKVIEVYIPDQYKNGSLLDVMDRTNIGFKVMIDNKIRNIELEQNEFNANIMKDDTVLIIDKDRAGKHFTDIELYDGEENE